MQDINWRIIINYDDIFKKLNWYFCSEVTSLDTIQISFFTPPHPPLLPPCYPGYHRSCTTGTARSVTGTGDGAADSTAFRLQLEIRRDSRKIPSQVRHSPSMSALA